MSFKVALIANVHNPIPHWVDQQFTNAGVEHSYHECYNRQDLERHAADADVLWLMSSRDGLVVKQNLDVFEKLGAVVKCGSGTDNIDHKACTEAGIIIAHTPDDVVEPTSNHFIAMLLAAVRQIPRHDRLVRRGVWDANAALPIGHLTATDLGLIGFGRIGQAIVRKLAGFEMVVRVYDPYVEAERIEIAHAHKVSLPELLKRSQFVLVACPLTDETRGLLGEAELRTMRRDAILVNCARAGIVDEEALIKALKEEWIAAAALDVLSKNPTELDKELVAMENVIFTPHVGGHPDNYPDELFINPVNVIIGLSRGEMPRWIANEGVVPRMALTRTDYAEATSLPAASDLTSPPETRSLPKSRSER